jgi:hypothetical protein
MIKEKQQSVMTLMLRKKAVMFTAKARRTRRTSGAKGSFVLIQDCKIFFATFAPSR